MRARLREIIRQTCEELGVTIIKGVLSTTSGDAFLGLGHAFHEIMRTCLVHGTGR